MHRLVLCGARDCSKLGGGSGLYAEVFEVAPAELSGTVGRRYTSWKQRLNLDVSATPEPRGVLVALSGLSSSKKDLDRIERLLMVLLQADPKKVKAARKLRSGWEKHRSRLYDARVRLPNRKPSTPTTPSRLTSITLKP